MSSTCTLYPASRARRYPASSRTTRRQRVAGGRRPTPRRLQANWVSVLYKLANAHIDIFACSAQASAGCCDELCVVRSVLSQVSLLKCVHELQLQLAQVSLRL